MSKDRNAFRAGLFIVVSVVAIIALVISIKGAKRMLEPRQVRTVVFDLSADVGGLRLGDDVRIGGVKQGVIRSIDLSGYETETTDDDKVMITFSIPQRFPIRDGASIRVQSTITGTTWLNIDHLGTGPVLGAEVALVGRPAAMSELLAAAGDLAPEIVATVRDVRGVTLPKVNDTIDKAGETAVAFKQTAETGTGFIEHVDAQVDPTAAKVHNVADRSAEMMTEARDLLGDTKGDIRGTMANLNSATGTVKDKLPGILDQVNDVIAKTSTAVERASSALEDVQATVANTRDISASAKGIVVGNRGRIDGMIKSLKSTSDNLDAASAEIRRSPWRLLYKPKKGEVAQLALYDSARQFAEGANDLNDAAVALRDALGDPTVDAMRVETLVAELDKTFEQFKTVEDELWTQVSD